MAIMVINGGIMWTSPITGHATAAAGMAGVAIAMGDIVTGGMMGGGNAHTKIIVAADHSDGLLGDTIGRLR